MKSAAEKIQVITGDCTIVLDTLEENSIDSCVTDPPYHLTNNKGTRSPYLGQYTPIGQPKSPKGGFMGKQWDGGDVAFRPETWAKVYRVLKPGAHLLAFGGTRTYHRMACAIEDAGFEIRDCIQWLYGSGFPKSHDVSKWIDRAAGAEREVVAKYRHPDGRPRPNSNRSTGDIYGEHKGALETPLTAPATDSARQWQGWGTALKPACEPIVLARKPLSEGTVAANVLKWGTGVLNIDGCRVQTEDKLGGGAENPDTDAVFKSEGWHRPWMDDPTARDAHSSRVRANVEKAQAIGRWPANVIHDGSEEVVEGFPETGISSGGRIGNAGGGDVQNIPIGKFSAGNPGLGDEGRAARFFYTAKADSFDRIGSNHPTVKPLDLMQYLVRLVTPKGGTVLDPFAGTGTTGEAAFREGMRAILIERDESYLADINRRIALCLSGPEEKAREIIKEKMKGKPLDSGPLFSEWDSMWTKSFDKPDYL